MAHLVLMPKAGQSMTEGKVVTWFKSEGDPVKEGEPLLEIETDKANLEVEAPEGGVLRKVYAPEGTILPVLAPVGVIGGGDEEIDFDALAKEAAPPAAPATETLEGAAKGAAETPSPSSRAASPKTQSPPPRPAPRRPAAPAPQPVQAVTTPPQPVVSTALRAPPPPRRDGRRVHASPLARRAAGEHGVDLRTVRGSGPRGRILRRDVEEAATSAGAAAGRGALTSRAGGPILPPAPVYPPPSPAPPATIPFEGMRGAIASALTLSKQSIPHFYASMVVDMTAALALKSAKALEGVKVTVNDLVLRATTLALVDEPRVNCRVFDDHIEVSRAVNLGVAVGVEEGLVVPVVLDAQGLGLEELSLEAKRIIELAGQGKLIGMGKGTFTVSNLGMFAVESFQAIINPPEGAILAVGTTSTELAPIAGGFFPRSVMRLVLSCDHRAIDGLIAARFLARIRYWLETAQLD